jgi:aryl sulfotransferase
VRDDRRFIKTHCPLDALPYHETVTYLSVGRDPRDVAVSSYFSWLNVNHPVARRAIYASAGVPEGSLPPPFVFKDGLQFFQIWMENAPPPGNPTGSLAGLVAHFGVSWERRELPNIVLIHYADLERDLDGEMRRVAHCLSIRAPNEGWSRLVEAARFEAMRNQADALVPEVHVDGLWNDNRAFFHQGVSGQWRELLTAADTERYEERLDQVGVDTALRCWMRDGRGPRS